jgi:hypothetical protein
MRLNQHTVRAYDLATERVHVDSISARCCHGSDHGPAVWPKDHRPDSAPGQSHAGRSRSLGMPLATDVVSDERADDPLYLPWIERVQAS